MASAAAASPEAVGTFKKVFEFEYEHVPVVLYRCSETGLRVAQAKVQSPTVHGYFAVQTEAFTDYGEPHTLEHLIFLGSERYPYKGVLDVLANRCLAQGTNAWTDVDHTCYTVDTAGSEGFLRILPVYLDHVLFPTLKDSGFVTEVHHINGEGANAGVVYCEMQARENEANDMMDRALKFAAYPGKCSYKSETGGRLKELRDLTNKMVIDYHRTYYRPDNLCVIVTGQADGKELCEACAPVVASIKESERIRSLPPFQKPFSSELPKPQGEVTERIDFPAEDEKTGAIVEFAWHGPRWGNHENITALSILLTYLTQDSISPLRSALAETAPPLCGKVSFSMLEQTTYLINVSLKDADVEQLGLRDAGAEVTKVLESVAAPGGAGIDLARMHSVIGQRQRRHLSSVESSPHDFFCGELIGAFLYAPDFTGSSGDCSAELRASLDVPACLKGLLAWPAERWALLCDEWLLKAKGSPRVGVTGFPSKACGERIQSEDGARIAAQKESLGEAGCKAKGEAVEAAEAENDVDTPDEVSSQFALPDVEKIRLVEVSTVTAVAGACTAVYGKEVAQVQASLEAAAKAAGGMPACSFQFDHATGAQFVLCVAMLPVGSLTVRQLELLPLWCDVAFELPMAASDLGPAMDYEDVVKALTDATVHYGVSVGFGGGRFNVGQAGNMMAAVIKVERERYTEAPFWMARVFADAQFDAERLRVAARRMLNDVPNSKRKPQGLMQMVSKAMTFDDSSPIAAFNAFRVERTLNGVLQDVDAVAVELAAIRQSLLSAPGGMLLRVGGDIVELGAGTFTPWRRAPFETTPFAPPSRVEAPRPALDREFFAKERVVPPPGSTVGCMVSSSAEESNYWAVQCESFTDPRCPELAPLLVAIEYITALEGPFWRKIRGRGLSYSYSLSHSLETGRISFGLFKAADPVAAFSVAREVVVKLCSEEGKQGGDGEQEGALHCADGSEEDDGEDADEGLDPSALEAAQSGVLFGLIEPVDTIPSAVGEAFNGALLQLPPDQLQWLLKAVQKVSEDEVRAALRKHLLPLFTGECGRRVSIVCPAAKRAALEEALAKLEPPIKVVHMEVDAFVSALAPSDGFAALRERVRALQT
ncbi:unnamed protein product [Prorocentrum cordatum]|uniref:Uncharacterized protein n=1 Tax=Prorocentrum cordatum TaxID=2364126 RepID=A0ABN9UA79_9DINO|nr:unnamed protein product [Polarella glacialis]